MHSFSVPPLCYGDDASASRQRGGRLVGQKVGTRDPEGPIQMMQLGIDMMALMTQIMMDQLGLITPPKGPASAPTK